MKNFILLLLFIPVILSAQQKSVHFKKIMEYLPASEIKGFERLKPTGSTQTVMNITSSEAQVTYSEKLPENSEFSGSAKAISVKIVDATYNPYVEMQFTLLGENYESESQSGYEKFTRVNGKYPGKITVFSEEYKYCVIEFSVASRYLVTVRGEGFDDVKFLNDVIAATNLEGLSKLKPEE